MVDLLVLSCIYEKYRKSSRQGGSSGESRDVCGGVMDEYSNVVKELRGVDCARCGDSHLRGRLLRFKCFELDVVSFHLVFPHLVPPKKISRRFCSPWWPNTDMVETGQREREKKHDASGMGR
ncbi:hypothetical protein PIB30_016307 [Stylosanthes scabra]|uniref:Uncharacterized protein n=1 Tax=Stylosanthes scabra TaxID=79078 RepID=A0ABU6R7I7_9FABA|nr:hypothetical protein [Stylosanthes scabra]